MFPFQISYNEWPTDIFEGDFYDMYISGRPYELNYVALQNLDPNNESHATLNTREMLVKKNFLSAYITIQQWVMEYRDIPKMSFASTIAQLAATMNLWAGITVIVVVEFIELLFETSCKSSNQVKREKDNRSFQ